MSRRSHEQRKSSQQSVQEDKARLLAGIDLEGIDLQIKIAQGQRKVDRLFLFICVLMFFAPALHYSESLSFTDLFDNKKDRRPIMKNTVKMITLLLAALASSTYAQRPEEKRPADPL
ncbi:MAG: hypothetical protein EOO38_04450, partial [Cytophagaceae bacterium]